MEMKKACLHQAVDEPKPRKEHDGEMDIFDQDFTKLVRAGRRKLPTLRKKWVES